MLRSVAVLALDQVAPFELGVLAEVFGTDRTADGFPGYRFTVCTADGGPVRTSSGFDLTPHADLGPVDDADLVAVPAHTSGTDVPGGGAGRAAPRRRPGGARVQRLLRRRSCSARPACSTAGSAPPTGGTSTSCSAATPGPGPVQLRSTSQDGRC